MCGAAAEWMTCEPSAETGVRSADVEGRDLLMLVAQQQVRADGSCGDLHVHDALGEPEGNASIALIRLGETH